MAQTSLNKCIFRAKLICLHQKCNGKHSVLQIVAMRLSRGDQIGHFLASREPALSTKKAGRLRGADPLRFQLTSRTSHEGREA
jgi:hypothetical protein